MMKNKIIFPALMLTLIILVSCDPVRRTTNMLVGEWQIVSFEEQIAGKQGVVATNVGTISLNEDKTGDRLFAVSIMGLSANDTTNFSWSATGNPILLDTGKSSEEKLWIISSIKKNSQTWVTTDGQAKMQIMTLERIKE